MTCNVEFLIHKQIIYAAKKTPTNWFLEEFFVYRAPEYLEVVPRLLHISSMSEKKSIKLTPENIKLDLNSLIDDKENVIFFEKEPEAKEWIVERNKIDFSENGRQHGAV